MAGTYRVTFMDGMRRSFEKDYVGEPAGVVVVAGDLRLKLISAEKPHRELLELAISMLNSSDEFMLRIPPPPDAENPRGRYARIVPRDSPEAPAALREKMLESYNFAVALEGTTKLS